MKLKKIQILIITGLISAALIGLIIIQVQLLKNSYGQKQQIFNQNVMSALQQTSQMLEINEAAGKVLEVAVKDSVKLPIKHGLKQPNNKLTTGYSYSYSTVDNSSRKPDTMLYKNYQIETRNDSIIKGIFINNTDSSLIYTSESSGNNKIPPDFFANTQNIPADCLKVNYIFHISSDSGKDVFSYFKYNVAADNLKKLDSAKKKVIVTGIVDRLLLWNRLPAEKRINRRAVDSLLKVNLKNAGINIPFNFGVITTLPDSSWLILNKGNERELKDSKYKSILFPSETFLPAKNYLTVFFPDTSSFLYMQILPQLLLSVLFILIIIAGFIYTLLTIFRQKKFGSLIIDFINNMTHEFKTPIATIALASEAMNQPEVINNEEKFFRYNKMIADENTRMRKQVDRILQMAVLEEGDYELNLSELDIHSVIKTAVNNFALLAESRNGKISMALNASRSIINGDAVHISGIISNVIDNAVKYSGEQPDIFISTRNVNDSVSIKISDKGMGISHEDLKKVFDKYYRVPSGNRHDIKGFGIGLSYVKLMVEAHKGEIKLESKYGEGTTVEIIIPLP